MKYSEVSQKNLSDIILSKNASNQDDAQHLLFVLLTKENISWSHRKRFQPWGETDSKNDSYNAHHFIFMYIPLSEWNIIY